MHDLTHLRCFNHVVREAVARCPECKKFFCRECITEHNDRVVCAVCLKRLAKTGSTQRRAFRGLVQFGRFAIGMLIAWFFFFLIGEALVRLPNTFHEGTLWSDRWTQR